MPSETASPGFDVAANTYCDISRDPVGEGTDRYTTYADVDDGQDGAHRSSERAKSLHAFAPANDPAREANRPLTRQALREHITINRPAHGKTIGPYGLDQHSIDSMALGNAAAYDVYNNGHTSSQAHEEPYSYPRRHTPHHLQHTITEADSISYAVTGLLRSQAEYRSTRAYPACINKVDLYDISLSSDPYEDVPHTELPPVDISAAQGSPEPAFGSFYDVYAGIGGQFTMSSQS